MRLIWELDFYSRPILDEAGKRLWEVVIHEAPIQVEAKLETCFVYAEYCPSSQVNSLWLKGAIERAMEKSGQQPTQIRFFRRQMNNMITKTCEDLGVPCVISRRAIALGTHLEHRYQSIYPQHPDYEDKPVPSVQYPLEMAQTMPDPLQGEQWRMVSLPFASLGEMPDWDISFGEAFPLEIVSLSPDTLIPGMIIYSMRALPLAAWMSGLEIGFLKLEEQSATNLASLLLETGASDRWVLANLPNENRLGEARSFEDSKKNAQGLHFLAIQNQPTDEVFGGFWLLQEREWG